MCISYGGWQRTWPGLNKRQITWQGMLVSSHGNRRWWPQRPCPHSMCLKTRRIGTAKPMTRITIQRGRSFRAGDCLDLAGEHGQVILLVPLAPELLGGDGGWQRCGRPPPREAWHNRPRHKEKHGRRDDDDGEQHRDLCGRPRVRSLRFS